MDSFVVFDILLFSIIQFSMFLFLPFSFYEVETASEMTKTILTHIIVNITISEHVELTRTVNAVSESKNIHKRGFREHCSLPL